MTRTPCWILTHWIILVLISRLLDRLDPVHPCTQQMTNRSFLELYSKNVTKSGIKCGVSVELLFPYLKWVIRHSHIDLFHLCNDHAVWPWGVSGIDSLLSSIVTPVGPAVYRFLMQITLTLWTLRFWKIRSFLLFQLIRF